MREGMEQGLNPAERTQLRGLASVMDNLDRMEAELIEPASGMTKRERQTCDRSTRAASPRTTVAVMCLLVMLMGLLSIRRWR